MNSKSKVILEVKNVSKKYGNYLAVNNVSFQVKEGEFLVILGLSGSGKTTVLNMIGGMDKVTKGNIIYKEKEVTKLKGKSLTAYRRDDIGFVFQAFNLINDITAKDNIILQSALLKEKVDIDSVLELVGLSEKKNSYPKELSGGEQQRVSIARALVKKSGLMLCDEPTGALDYETGRKIITLLYHLCHKEKRTIIFVTHTKEIAKIADHVIEMRSGKIINDYYNSSTISPSHIEW